MAPTTGNVVVAAAVVVVVVSLALPARRIAGTWRILVLPKLGQEDGTLLVKGAELTLHDFFSCRRVRRPIVNVRPEERVDGGPIIPNSRQVQRVPEKPPALVLARLRRNAPCELSDAVPSKERVN